MKEPAIGAGTAAAGAPATATSELPDNQPIHMTAGQLRAYTDEAIRTASGRILDQIAAAQTPEALRGVFVNGAVGSENPTALADAAFRSSPAVIIRKYDANPYRKYGKEGEDFSGLVAARFARAIGASHMRMEQAIPLAKRWLEETHSFIDEVNVRALQESTFVDGGVFVRPELSSEMIELLQANTVVRRAGVQIQSTKTGTIEYNKETSAPQASYTGETPTGGTTGATFGLQQATVKKLRAVVPISNDLLKDPGFAADIFVRNRLVKAHRVREDLAFLRGDGANNTPKGLINWATTNRMHAQSSWNLGTMTSDLNDMLLKLEEQNIDPDTDQVVWFMAPRTVRALMKIRDTNGNFAFKDEMVTGKLLDRPFFPTNQIPKNLGGGTNESELIAAAMNYCFILEREDVTIEAYAGGAYHDGTNMQSGITNDQTVLVSTQRHDFYVTQETGIVYMDQVLWV